jgi:hypothetical protein
MKYPLEIHQKAMWKILILKNNLQINFNILVIIKINHKKYFK